MCVDICIYRFIQQMWVVLTWVEFRLLYHGSGENTVYLEFRGLELQILIKAHVEMQGHSGLSEEALLACWSLRLGP